MGTSAGVIPPFLLERIAAADRLVAASDAARRTLAAQAPPRRAAIAAAGTPSAAPAAPPAGGDRRIYDAKGTGNLPGTLVRTEGDAESADVAVDEAYDGLGRTRALFGDVYGRNSIDGRGMALDATVHYGADYDNAFWNGTQMVFGDGDGEVFRRFTISLSVIGHELAHGVTARTANLAYRGQSGALNESMSDVFGCLVEQYARGQTTEEASWLIGEGLFTPRVQGVALRSLKAPGTAYDDDVIGSDPQPATMDGYVDTSDDDGGVHINSGIPNHAFYRAAARVGGRAWETVGRVWYDVLTGGTLTTTASFADFARATIDAARNGFGSSVVDAVRTAWTEVGVIADPGRRDAPSDAGTLPIVTVTRSGGIAGIARSWTVDVAAQPDPDGWCRLLAALPWDAARGEDGDATDRFSYRIGCSPVPGAERMREVTLAESQLSGAWADLLERVRSARG